MNATYKVKLLAEWVGAGVLSVGEARELAGGESAADRFELELLMWGDEWVDGLKRDEVLEDVFS